MELWEGPILFDEEFEFKEGEAPQENALKRKYDDFVCTEAMPEPVPSTVPLLPLMMAGNPMFKSVEIYWSFVETFPTFPSRGVTREMVPYLFGRLTSDTMMELYRNFHKECSKAITDFFETYFPDEEHGSLLKAEFLYILRCFRSKVNPDIGRFRCRLEARGACYALINAVKDHPVTCSSDLVVEANEELRLHDLVKERWTDLFITEKDELNRYVLIASHLQRFIANHKPADNQAITDAVLRLMVTPQPLLLPGPVSPVSTQTAE